MATHKYDKCKVCEERTQNIININLTKVPICELCITSIFIQQANWYVERHKFDPIMLRKGKKGVHY